MNTFYIHQPPIILLKHGLPRVRLRVKEDVQHSYAQLKVWVIYDHYNPNRNPTYSYVYGDLMKLFLYTLLFYNYILTVHIQDV